jgi:hypothetical protein
MERKSVEYATIGRAEYRDDLGRVIASDYNCNCCWDAPYDKCPEHGDPVTIQQYEESIDQFYWDNF